MPQAAFRDLWVTAKSGHPWEGLVKNRTKNGDYYWVRANVTPVVERGELKGFISIRTRLERDEVAAAEAIYASMREGRSRGLEVKAGAVVRTGLVARWQRVTRGIASSFAINLGIFFAATAVSLTAGAMGVCVEVRAPALLGVAVMIVIATALSMHRMRQPSGGSRHTQTRLGASMARTHNLTGLSTTLASGQGGGAGFDAPQTLSRSGLLREALRVESREPGHRLFPEECGCPKVAAWAQAGLLRVRPALRRRLLPWQEPSPFLTHTPPGATPRPCPFKSVP